MGEDGRRKLAFERTEAFSGVRSVAIVVFAKEWKSWGGEEGEVGGDADETAVEDSSRMTECRRKRGRGPVEAFIRERSSVTVISCRRDGSVVSRIFEVSGSPLTRTCGSTTMDESGLGMKACMRSKKAPPLLLAEPRNWIDSVESFCEALADKVGEMLVRDTSASSTSRDSSLPSSDSSAT